MTPYCLGFLLLLNVHENDLHNFPNQPYAWSVYNGVTLSLPWANDEQEWLSLQESQATWGLLHGAWMMVTPVYIRKQLFLLRCRIGWRAYERGEMPVPPVRIRP